MGTLGSRIRDLRNKKNLSMGALAKKIIVHSKEYEGAYKELSSATISNIENDKHSPNADIVVALAKFFNVSTDFLLLGTDNQENEDSYNIPLLVEEDINVDYLTKGDVSVLKSLITFIGQKKKDNEK